MTERISRELILKVMGILADKDIGIILLTEKFGRDFPDYVNSIKLATKMPIIIDVPDRHGSGRRSDFITAYVNEAIGLKL